MTLASMNMEGSCQQVASSQGAKVKNTFTAIRIELTSHYADGVGSSLVYFSLERVHLSLPLLQRSGVPLDPSRRGPFPSSAPILFTVTSCRSHFLPGGKEGGAARKWGAPPLPWLSQFGAGFLSRKPLPSLPEQLSSLPSLLHMLQLSLLLLQFTHLLETTINCN